MIRLISGACRVGNKLMRPSDGSFALSQGEEAYLVSRGVARYAEDLADSQTVQKPTLESPNDTDVALHETENSAEETSEAEGGGTSFDEATLLKMRRDDLDKLAANLGIDSKDCANKREVVNKICSVTADDEMPALNVEAPVE